MPPITEIIRKDRPAGEIIGDLKKKTIEVPAWATLEKEYDPKKHPVYTDNNYKDKVDGVAAGASPSPPARRPLSRRHRASGAGDRSRLPAYYGNSGSPDSARSPQRRIAARSLSSRSSAALTMRTNSPFSVASHRNRRASSSSAAGHTARWTGTNCTPSSTNTTT